MTSTISFTLWKFFIVCAMISSLPAFNSILYVFFLIVIITVVPVKTFCLLSQCDDSSPISFHRGGCVDTSFTRSWRMRSSFSFNSAIVTLGLFFSKLFLMQEISSPSWNNDDWIDFSGSGKCGASWSSTDCTGLSMLFESPWWSCSSNRDNIIFFLVLSILDLDVVSPLSPLLLWEIDR